MSESIQIDGQEYFNGGNLERARDQTLQTLAYRKGEEGAFDFRTVPREMFNGQDYILGESPELPQYIQDEARRLDEVRKELRGE